MLKSGNVHARSNSELCSHTQTLG